MRVEASHGNPAILGLSITLATVLLGFWWGGEGEEEYHVNVILLFKKLDLRLGQPGKTEHTNLIGDMFPFPGGALGLEPLTQALAHINDATTHGAQVVFPHGEQLRVVQDATGDVGSIGRGVGDFRPLQGGQLGGDVGRGRDGIRTGGGDEMKGSRALAIQAEVLGERLGDTQLEALVDEIANRPRVADQIARGEPLVRAVEEGEVVALPHRLGDLLPLLLGGIHAGRVVGARMEQDHGAGGGRSQSRQHAVDIQAFGLRVEVRVLSQ